RGGRCRLGLGGFCGGRRGGRFLGDVGHGGRRGGRRRGLGGGRGRKARALDGQREVVGADVVVATVRDQHRVHARGGERRRGAGGRETGHRAVGGGDARAIGAEQLPARLEPAPGGHRLERDAHDRVLLAGERERVGLARKLDRGAADG